ncbi:MAG: hypothetical protein Q9M92_14995 [Enterobacterales bacterium]|nr:hypothetical protein [Enterobacterales bacterium]
MRILIVIIFFILINIGSVNADVPDKFIGKWSVTFIPREGFPWWTQIKYPIYLEINQSLVMMDFGHDIKCTPNILFYDDEIDAIVFNHCLPKKSELAFAPVFIFSKIKRNLLGKVVTYKELFELEGKLLEGL